MFAVVAAIASGLLFVIVTATTWARVRGDAVRRRREHTLAAAAPVLAAGGLHTGAVILTVDGRAGVPLLPPEADGQTAATLIADWTRRSASVIGHVHGPSATTDEQATQWLERGSEAMTGSKLPRPTGTKRRRTAAILYAATEPMPRRIGWTDLALWLEQDTTLGLSFVEPQEDKPAPTPSKLPMALTVGTALLASAFATVAALESRSARLDPPTAAQWSLPITQATALSPVETVTAGSSIIAPTIAPSAVMPSASARPSASAKKALAPSSKPRRNP